MVRRSLRCAVVGTTGFTAEEIDRLRKRFADAGSNAVIAPNFAIGAVLMMRLAELAAPFFDTAEVIELHHDNKVDAPSGTAMMTVQRIADASSDWAADPTKSGSGRETRRDRSGGIRVHSLRVEGSSRTKRCCSARRVSRSRSATTRTTGRRTCRASCSRSAVCASSPGSRWASTRFSISECPSVSRTLERGYRGR